MDYNFDTTNGEDCGHFVCTGIIFLKPIKACNNWSSLLSALNRFKQSTEEKKSTSSLILTKHSQQRKPPNGDVRYFKEKTLQYANAKKYGFYFTIKKIVLFHM